MTHPRPFNHSFSFQSRTGYSRSLRQLILSTILTAALATIALAQGEEFFGPMPSWINVRGAPYNAAGNGIADDTAALQQALNDSTKPGKSVYVYLPAGTYRITDTLVVTGLRGLRLVGEDPATTTDVRLYGVQIGYGRAGIRISR